MGLDNGIILKLKENKVPEDFPSRESLNSFDLEEVEKRGELEIAYWRKCWGIRAAIIDVLHMKDSEEWEHPVEVDDCPALRRALMKFLRPDYWEENADSIWEYDEYFEHMLDVIFNLKWLEKRLKDHPEETAFFYDSY
jgi:hypothetical protein